MLVSNELRFPLVNDLSIALPIGGIRFIAIGGALFFDIGNAWENQFGNSYGSFGLGIRVPLGGLTTLRFDFARRTDFISVSKNTRIDFFFGWDY